MFLAVRASDCMHAGLEGQVSIGSLGFQTGLGVSECMYGSNIYLYTVQPARMMPAFRDFISFIGFDFQIACMMQGFSFQLIGLK